MVDFFPSYRTNYCPYFEIKINDSNNVLKFTYFSHLLGFSGLLKYFFHNPLNVLQHLSYIRKQNKETS